MAPSHYVDIHPHIISTDDRRYPRNALFGVQSDWSRERPVTIDQYIAEMDAAGVQKAAIVQASTCYGYDNSYLTDSVARYPGRLTAVGSVDLLRADAPTQIGNWITRGVTGLRLFTGGSTKAFDPGSLDDPRSFAAWELCAEAGLSICLQTDPSGLIYMQARFYAPWFGRFLSPDPARDQHFEETQSWNIYSYEIGRASCRERVYDLV